MRNILKNWGVAKLSILAVALIFSAAALVGCGGKDNGGSSSDDNKDKKKVVATTCFVNDMIKNVAGDAVDVDMIIPVGDDPHLYVAKPEDLKKIDEADLTLYHGLHFEGKMTEALEKKGKAISEDFPKDKLGKMDEDGKVIVDPHFWFDLDLYKMAVEKVTEHLVALVPDKKDEFEKNSKDYIAKLDELDKEVQEKVSAIPKESRYLITPHDAFNYFARAYDVTVQAPQGVSTDSDVSTAGLEKTAKLIADHKIKAIFAESTTDPARMKKLQEIVKSKGFDVKVVSGEGNELLSDSLAEEGKDGDNFIDMYKHNVKLMYDNLK